MTQKKPVVKSKNTKPKKLTAKVDRPQPGFPIVHNITDHKQAEESLLALSKRQEAILVAVPDILMEVNNDKVYTWANPAGLAFFGEDVIGKGAAFYFEGEQDTYGVVKPLFNGSEDVIYVESWQRRKDGEKRLLAWWCRVIKDVEGNATGALSTGRDITERKQVEQALAESEIKFKWLYEYAPSAYHLLTPDGTITDVNRRWCDLLGYRREEVLGRAIFDFVVEEEREAAKASFEKKKQSREPYVKGSERNFKTKDGAVRMFKTYDFFVMDQRQNLTSVQTTIEDITERKQAKDALLRSESSLQAVLQSTADGILAVGSENEVLYANERFVEMWRIPQAVMASKDDSVLLQHVLGQLSDPQSFLKKVQELYKSKKESFDTLDFKDGRVFERLSHPLMQGEKVRGRVWSFRDITERKRAEEALRESERELKEAQLLGRVGNWEYDLESQKITWSDQAYRLYERDPVLGPPTAEEEAAYYSPEQAQMLHEYARRAVEEGQEFEYDLEATLPSGKRVYFSAKMRPVKDARGRIVKLFGTVQNITERKRAEQALRESEEKYRTILENIEEGYFEVDIAGNFTFFNESVCRLLGYSREEMMGMNNRHYTDKTNAQKLYRAFNQVYRTGVPAQGHDWELIRKDGTKRYVECSVSLRKNKSSQPIGFRGIIRDITERKQVEDRLVAERNLLNTLIDNLPDNVFVKNVDGRIVIDNIAHRRLLGTTTLEEVVGKTDFDFFAKKLAASYRADEQEIIHSGKPLINREEPTIDTDGKQRWLLTTKVPLRDQQGKIAGIVGINRDITERKLAEEQIRLSEERYRMLAENMSDTVWLMDMSLRTTYISPSVTRLRGFSLDEINSIPLDQQMTPDSLQRTLQMFAETLSPENLAQPDRLISRTVELEFIKKDGTRFWSENTFTLIRDPQGQPFAILGSGRDINESKKAEEALQNSEKYFRALIENNTDAVVLVDPRGMILYESPQNARMLGRATGQRLGKSGYENIHAEDRGSVAQMLNELVQHPGEIRHTTFRNQHEDGSWRWIEATGTNLLAESAVHGLVINMHDITGRKQAEMQIRHRVADLEVLYEYGLSTNVLLEPRKIAQKMIEILSQKLDWHIAAIRLVHPETKHTEFLVLKQPGLTPIETQAEIDRLNKIFVSPNQGLSGWVIKHGKTIRSGDVQADKRYLSFIPEIRSGLYVPLMIGERAIGSIAVESRQANRFSADDERLLQTLAAQSAIAIENARLYQEAVSAAKRKAALHQGGLEIVRAGQEIEALCIALHHAVQQVMPAEAFTVSLLTEDSLEVEAPYLYDWGIRHPNTRLPAGAGITGRVIKSKKPLRIKDVQKTRGVKPIMVGESEPTRAVLSVPLLAQNKIIGVISAQSREADVYSVEDQIFMETLASEAAVAFENARLFEEIRHRLTELESLSQVSDSLTSAIDLQPLLENILAGARNAIPAAEKGTILLAEPDGALRLHAMSGYTDPRLISLVLSDQKGYATRVARERNPIKIDDAHAEYEIPDNGTIEEINSVQSGIAAPLIVKGKVIGVISLDNASRKSAFTESDLRLLVTFASSAAVAIENARLFTETQQRLHRLSALHSIDAAIGASVDTHVTLGIVLEHVMTELKADAAAVLLFNPLTRMLEYAAGRGFRVHVIEGLRLRLGEGLAGQSVLQRRAINIADLQQAGAVEQVMEHPVSGSALVPLQYLEGENFVAYHAIPLIAKGQVQGVLEIFRRTPMQVDQEWITFFEMLAGQTAIAIDNGRLFENLQHSNLELTLAYDATIQGWSQALELRDEGTEGHTLRVTDLTLRLIQAMGLEEVEMEHARRGSLLHDIGKIAIPDSILLKPGPLDEREWSVMRQHPQYAYNMLSPITYLAPAIHIPYCHHEKWDGSGYPRGLKGEEIPMVARIFAILDVYDALTSNRPYRLAWTRENAMEYIREQSGKHFDPKVVKAFMGLMADEK